MQESDLKPRKISQGSRQCLILLLSITCLFVLQAVLRPGSVTLAQGMNISRQASTLGIVVLGQTLVILTGGIDLSVGSIVTITNVFAVSYMKGQDENFFTAVLVCAGIGLAAGAVNAIGVLKLKIAPFVMTLCTSTMLQGIYLVYTGGSPSGNVSPSLKQIGNGLCAGVIPYPTLIWTALAVLLWIALSYTPFGRYTYAVGENPDAAGLCGISVDRIKISAYLLSSLFAVAAGLLASGYIGTTSLSLGNDYITNSLAAVLIGGNSIEGGKGGVWGGFLGAFLLMLLFALLTMVHVGQAGKLVIQGVIIFAVVFGQRYGLGRKG